MKKRTISKLKSIFSSKKGKRHQELSSKSSRSPSPETPGTASPVSPLNDDSFRSLLRTPPPARIGPPPSPPIPTQPIAPVAPEPPAPLPLMPCQVCGRTFVPQSLAKHVKICEKMTIKKRKTFDSSRQRREGTDLEQYLPKNFGLPENSPFLEKSSPPIVKPTPKPKPQSIRSAITKVSKPTADLQRCPHCNRAFGVRAFERHVEWCADKAKILPAAPAQAPQHITDAKQRLNARKQYKAPLVRTRRSSQTRDQSSNSRSASVDSSRGVSPPPRPREGGDYKHGRVRASESASSNDCPEESSLHVPVIRNSRHKQNSSSGDANVKARQARLARDISNTRNNQDPDPSSLQESFTDPNIKKNVSQNKPRNILNIRKQQQLKKLEQIATKYSENIQDKKKYERESVKRTVRDNSNIPLPKRINNKRVDTSLYSNIKTKTENIFDDNSPNQNTTSNTKYFKASSEISINNKTNMKIKENTLRKKIKKQPINAVKENSMSIDSLDECPLISTRSSNNRDCHSVGINTELQCVPCIIHDNLDQKKENNTFIKNLKNNSPIGIKNGAESNNFTSGPKLELLYKNPTLNSNRKISPINHNKKIYIKDEYANKDTENCTYTPTSDNFTFGTVIAAAANDKNQFVISETKLNRKDSESSTHMAVDLDRTHKLNNTVSINEAKSDDVCITFKDNTEGDTEQINEEIYSLSAEERYDENDHDISNDYIEAKYHDDNIDRANQIECRHGSCETYTKITEDPADLQEFLNLTDKLLTNDQLQAQYSNIDQDIDFLHTPKTSSLEAINNQDFDTLKVSKHHFSDGFEELKSDLKELLKNKINTSEIDKTNEYETKKVNENNSAASREVDDLEHITVYKLKFYEGKSKENISTKVESQFKLPSIMETKTPGSRVESIKKMQNMYKSNRKFKMLGEQRRSNKDYQTFIVQQNSDHSDNQSVSDAPPLKLPRIEKKRLDENYDPFVCAARQMKELMSSETNIPNKIQTSTKDHSRTLPALQPNKEKGSSSYIRSDNTKMLKDTLNKTYQKTPTLQRMKSFGSTNNENSNNSFSGRCSSFRLNRNDKRPSPKLNTTFTKSSKENISNVDKNYFNRSCNLNRSFSNYTASSYSTPKVKEKVPKISTSLYHSFQRSTTKQSIKLEKIPRENEKKELVNLDSILADDNSSMTDSNYIDPSLINENDNLPINVNTILNNPDIISSMESLITTENLPAKFESFSTFNQNNTIYTPNNIHTDLKNKVDTPEPNNNVNKNSALIVDTLSMQYDKLMYSLEQSIASKTSNRDDDSLCEDFDLEEFMTSFDEEIDKHKLENKRTCSSTTRIVKQSDLLDSNRTSEINSISSSPKVINSMTPVNKPISLNFSNNNIASENLFPSSMKRSTSLLDSIQKKNTLKMESGKSHQKSDQLEQDIMQSLKDFDKFYETEKNETLLNKETTNYNGTTKNLKSEKKIKKTPGNLTNGSYMPNGKISNDSAYSSLNRISPSKLSICTSKETNGLTSLEQIPAGSDSSGSHKEDVRSISSEEFLAMERSAELDEPLSPPEPSYKEQENHISEKRVSSRSSSRRSSTWRIAGGTLSSSGSEASLHQVRRDSAPAPRLSRFCHECGHKFTVDTAKFCIECGVKRLII